MTITYKDAGVDIEAGDRFVQRIAPLAKATFRPGVLLPIGGFGAPFELDIKKFSNPVLVSGSDGVGTKLSIAFAADVHDTIGIDLVAMCVNDVLTAGAEPLFFLDYLATGGMDEERLASVVTGIAAGCKKAGAALVGGETAEMPGFYKRGEYEMAGFCVGAVDKSEMLDCSNCSEGDVIIGLKSSGLHSNGYSLARKVFFDLCSYKVDTRLEELGRSVGEELLEPTRIYVRAVLNALQEVKIKAMAHITGGGIPGNLSRIIGDGLDALIDTTTWEPHPVFNLISREGNVPRDEMFRTFNMGIGFCLVTAPADADQAMEALRKGAESPVVIGRLAKGKRKVFLE
ncbi:MAG: phosphoribosylformylglycinamidine cyclo-ligase [Deltaproteobacteria bacterium]|nr:phosphoribosylformylglycinamidine cyclo-ligase [Deltaproteobacteria bacterium]